MIDPVDGAIVFYIEIWPCFSFCDWFLRWFLLMSAEVSAEVSVVSVEVSAVSVESCLQRFVSAANF